MKRREVLGFLGAGALLSLSGCSSKGGLFGRGADGSDVMIDGRRALDIKVIYFDFDSSEILPEFRRVLSAHALQLISSKKRITIEGHTDERGTREYNIGLGERRANAVRSYLIAEGVPASQITTLSFGEERPVDYGHNETAWAKNRRAVLDY